MTGSRFVLEDGAECLEKADDSEDCWFICFQTIFSCSVEEEDCDDGEDDFRFFPAAILTSSWSRIF